MTSRPVFVLLAAALVLAGQVAGPWTAPAAVAALCIGRALTAFSSREVGR